MDAPDPEIAELQRLIQANAAMQQKIAKLEQSKAQAAQKLEERRKELSQTLEQRQEIRNQLLMLGKSGVQALLVQGLDDLAIRTYFYLLPPAQNPSLEREFVDSSFFIAKSLALNPVVLKTLYRGISRPKKISKKVDRRSSEIEQPRWLIPGICKFYGDGLIKGDFFNNDAKSKYHDLDIGARMILFTATTVLLPVAVVHDSVKIAKNCFSSSKIFFRNSTQGISHDEK